MIPINLVLDDNWLHVLKSQLGHLDVLARRAEITLVPHGIRIVDQGQLVRTTTLVLFGNPPPHGRLLGPANAVTLYLQLLPNMPLTGCAPKLERRATTATTLTVERSAGRIEVNQHRRFRKPIKMACEDMMTVTAVSAEVLIR